MSARLLPSFQARVRKWLVACFGTAAADDRVERCHRFLEESLELGQACGCTRGEAHTLVDYVFDRPIGQPRQEAGGVVLTLAGLCEVRGFDFEEAGVIELGRVWEKFDVIRAKQAAKPAAGPAPNVTILPCVRYAELAGEE